MKNIYKIKVLILTAFLFAACTEGFEEINVDKNLPLEANSGQLLTSTIFDGLNPHLNVQLGLTNQIMQYNVFRNSNDLDAYNFVSGAGTFESFWKAAYHVILDSNESIAFAEENQIPIATDKRGEAPFSVDANLLHTSSEGKVLEDPAVEAPDYVYQRTVSPEDAPNTPEFIEVGFERGDAMSINGETLSPATILTRLNELGGKHGIGRLDLVEGRFVGMKSRGIYETPGGTILLEAHRGIEQITLDRGAAHLKDELMPKYAELIYNGFWYSPEREMLQALIDASQEHVTGTVRLKLYKGSAHTVGRWSEHSLYSEAHVTFEDDAGAYDQTDAAGFIQLNALRLKLLAARKNRLG